MQLTLPLEFVHEYQAPPDTSWAFTTAAVLGVIVNETASMFAGFEPFGVYVTLVIA